MPARTFKYVFLATLTISILLGCKSNPSKLETYDIVIHGGRVIDPESEIDAIRNIGIKDGKILEISTDSLAGNTIIDATTLVVAPGFINLNAHDLSDEQFRLMLMDGITTAFQTEVGTADVEQWYKDLEGGQFCNYGVGIGHIPVRMKVMGDQGGYLPSGPGGRLTATEDQLEEIKALVEEGLKQGAVGVGFGLAYTPAATNSEFRSVMRIAANHGVFAYIHLRATSSWNPDPTLSGLKEAISAAADTGVSLHVAHANSSSGPYYNEFLQEITLANINGVRVTTDAYPYEAGSTFIESALFDDWESWPDERFKILEWAGTGERLNRESFTKYHPIGGHVHMHTRTEKMTKEVITHPLVMISNDGNIQGGKGHPRMSGSFTKVIGKYVRDQKALSLIDALKKMTIEPARVLEGFVPDMKDKGRIQIGADSDIVIFKLETIQDRATYSNPIEAPVGIEYVLVNGEIVVKSGNLQISTRPGEPIRSVNQ